MRSRSVSRLLGLAAKGSASLLGAVVDLLLPPACPVCGEARGREGLCRDCASALPLFRRHPCPGCGASPVAGPLDFCPPCRGAFRRDGLCAAASFEGPVRELVHAFKYRGDLAAGGALAGLLAPAVLGSLRDACDTVVPVPLHRRRLRSRGFNQSALLGKAVGRAAGWPLLPRALVRLRDTRPLAGLPAGDRRREVRGMIAARPGARLEGMRVLLVDDVVTSGATVEECCRALKAAGAAEVTVAAAARALPGKRGFYCMD